MITKKSILKIFSLVCLLFFTSVYSQERLEGTWSMERGSMRESLVFVEGYVSHVVYDVENKTFVSPGEGNIR